ncbi:MAG: hypothetical protein IJ762_07865 [Bacteroidaceae bacterium]|nr:hypothetical protein [Bacteroidaceae bacterium]
MKKILCTFAIMVMVVCTSICRAMSVNTPVFMALTGNYITVDCSYSMFRVVDDLGNTAFSFFSNGGIQNGTTYDTAYHSQLIGFASIDTERTYHMEYDVSNYLQFTANGPAYTQGFGIYFTTWEWPYYDYTVGEVTFWNSNASNQSYIYRIDQNNPGSISIGYFCPDTDAIGNVSTLKLFIDFGLGHPYYQNVYYAAGDNGF